MSWDLDYFGWLVILTLPAATLYPVIYVCRARWWKSWIGMALLFKATGLATLLWFTAALLVLGPDYPGRYAIRNTGITFILVGVWCAFIAMLREFHTRPRRR
ncbi:hypothetical protein [uncultured Arthrobacter sp.]|uniref:putative phage holin n=1 Tax=uncultured Arthrobacter sp. TaxID=114050 RepID=UPI0025CBD67E|nr:hypothetical protein [uncultured Arthrobacter sp.]